MKRFVALALLGGLLTGGLFGGGSALASAPDPRPMNVMPDELARSVWQRQHQLGKQNHMQEHMAAMLTPLRPLKGKAFDIRWTQLMIDHHQMAIDMARPELLRGTDARVKAAAQRVINAQQKEIASMQGWLKTWTGKSYAPQPMTQLMPMGMDGVGSMDRWFLEGMTVHHQGAIDMAALIPGRSQNVALRKLGADIIHVQTAEIAEYQAMLKTLK